MVIDRFKALGMLCSQTIAHSSLCAEDHGDFAFPACHKPVFRCLVYDLVQDEHAEIHEQYFNNRSHPCYGSADPSRDNQRCQDRAQLAGQAHAYHRGYVNSRAQLFKLVSALHSYDNAGKTSEVTKTLTSGKDWTEQGVTKLVVWFSGDSGNAADRMYVALGNAVVYHPDDAATQDTGWNEWVIDLTEFTGVDLTNVNTITLGFGTRNAPVATGGIGTVEFDDIRLIK